MPATLSQKQVRPDEVAPGTLDRFWKHVAQDGDKESPDCWLWKDALNTDGYGRFTLRGQTFKAHRFAYELLVGPVPEGRELHHTCLRPECVNPAHLTPLTRQEHNAITKSGRSLRGRKRTICRNGHHMTPENSYFSPQGKRSCRECHHASARRWRESKRHEEEYQGDCPVAVHFHSRPQVAPLLKPRSSVRTWKQRAKDLTHPALKQQLLSHADEVAGMICDCLAIPQGRAFGFNCVWSLCCEHGCEPLIVPEMPKNSGGMYVDWGHENTEFSDGGYILLSAHMTFAESCAVMIHELTHRLLYTPRFADWLDKEREYRCYEEREWQEAVARAVERKFLEAGGTGLIPPRY